MMLIQVHSIKNSFIWSKFPCPSLLKFTHKHCKCKFYRIQRPTWNSSTNSENYFIFYEFGYKSTEWMKSWDLLHNCYWDKFFWQNVFSNHVLLRPNHSLPSPTTCSVLLFRKNVSKRNWNFKSRKAPNSTSSINKKRNFNTNW